MTWRTAQLGDICSPKQHKTIPASTLLDEGFPVYGANGQIGFYSEYTHEDETVAITCRGATCGTINVAPAKSYITGNAMALDDLDQGRVDLRFLVYALRNRGLHDVISGSAQPQITRGPLLAVEIPLPPLEEQKRIAAILDQADELRRKRQRALDRLNQLGQAIFIEMFGDPIENPFRYAVRSLEELIQPDRPLTYGILMPGEDVAGGVPYIRVVDMRDGGIQVSSIRRTTPEISTQYKRSLLRPGDILISIRGHVGRTAIVPAILEGANITQDTARIACAGCAPDFLNELLRHYRMQDWMARRTKGAAVKGINLGDLRNLPVIVPPLDQQERFGEMVKAARGLAGQTQSQQLALYALFASLQDRAFRGELTASSLKEAAE
jgi:type I restriction enzyme S subunit